MVKKRVVSDEKQYPYIEEINKKDLNSLTKVHITKDFYIEINNQDNSSIALVEHGDPHSNIKTSLTFKWEFFNYPNNKNMRNLFGKMDLYSYGYGKVLLPGNFTFFDKFEDLTVSDIFDGYERYKMIKEGLLGRL
jgi:hypothetical protein